MTVIFNLGVIQVAGGVNAGEFLAGVIDVLMDDGVPMWTDGDVRRAASDEGDDEARLRRSASRSSWLWLL